MEEVPSPERDGCCLFLVPVAVGAAAVGYAVMNREEPQRLPPEERTTPVRVVTAPAVEVVPRALGYGSVMPGRVWEAGGRGERHRHLPPSGAREGSGPPGPGRSCSASTPPTTGSPSRRSRPTSARPKPSSRSSTCGRRTRSVRSPSRNEAIALGRKELDRKRRLAKQGTISQAAVDPGGTGGARRGAGGPEPAQLDEPPSRRALGARGDPGPAPGPSWRRRGGTCNGPRSSRRSTAGSRRSTWRRPSSRPRARCWWWRTASTWRRSPPRFRSAPCSPSSRATWTCPWTPERPCRGFATWRGLEAIVRLRTGARRHRVAGPVLADERHRGSSHPPPSGSSSRWTTPTGGSSRASGPRSSRTCTSRSRSGDGPAPARWWSRGGRSTAARSASPERTTGSGSGRWRWISSRPTSWSSPRVSRRASGSWSSDLPFAADGMRLAPVEDPGGPCRPRRGGGRGRAGPMIPPCSAASNDPRRPVSRSSRGFRR